MKDEEIRGKNIYSSYGADAIGVSDNVERHRRSPAQYLGSSNVNGIRNQKIELMFNAFDESIEYHNLASAELEASRPNMGLIVPPFVVDIVITEDDQVMIRDMGRGMPCDTHPDTQEPAVFSIFENDSAGAKGTFSNSVYSSEGTSGMHGAGAAVSKSCTEYFDVEIKEGNSGNIYMLRYIRGYREKNFGDNGLFLAGKVGPHPYQVLANIGLLDTGTTIRYKFDPTVLEPKKNGVLTDPYDKEDLIKVIQMYLLGLKNKDRLVVRLNFKGEERMISPYDFTPEKYLGVEPTSQNLLVVPAERTSKVIGDKANFSCKMYMSFSEHHHSFSVKTVVNKLEQRLTKHDSRLEDTINQTYREIIREWVKQNPKKEYIIPHGSIFKPANKFKLLVVMDLPVAEFGGQTKDRLESDAYIGHMRHQLGMYIKENIDKFMNPISYFQEEVIENTKFAKRKLKDEEKAKLRQEKTMKEASEQAYVDTMKDDLAARMSEEEKGAFSLDIKRPSSIKYDSCVVCFFEGDSANIAVNKAIDNGAQIVSVVTKGKLPNIHKNADKISEGRIRQMRIHIFSKQYARYIIFVDPDADGNHIRTQILKIIERFRPDMLSQGRVSVCRAPYGRVINRNKENMELVTPMEGTRILPPGENFVLSYEEMEQAIEKGALKISAFRGALDVFTQCQDILSFEEMINDPLYLVKIQPPTRDDIELLNDVLSTESNFRSSVTRKMYTQRQRYSKYIAKKSTKNKLGIKIKDMSRPTVCKVTETPNLTDVYQFGLPNFGTTIK